MAEVIGSGVAMDDAKLLALEKVLGYKLPNEYREFLVRYNGGFPVPDGFDFENGDGSSIDKFLGVGTTHHDLEQYISTYGGRLAKGFIPIAHDPGGNLVCMGVDQGVLGQIYFWDHEMEADYDESPGRSNMHYISNSLSEFLSGLRRIDI